MSGDATALPSACKDKENLTMRKDEGVAVNLKELPGVEQNVRGKQLLRRLEVRSLGLQGTKE